MVGYGMNSIAEFQTEFLYIVDKFLILKPHYKFPLHFDTLQF